MDWELIGKWAIVVAVVAIIGYVLFNVFVRKRLPTSVFKGGGGGAGGGGGDDDRHVR